MQAKITEEEEKFLQRMEKKFYDSISQWYITVGMLLMLAIFGLIGGILTKDKGGFMMAIFCGTIGFSMIVTAREHRRYINIIKKLRES